MEKIVLKKCLWCNHDFVRENNAQKYCCKDHSKEALNYRHRNLSVTTYCLHCGKEITSATRNQFGNKKFCKKACRDSFFATKKRKELKTEKIRMEICPYCLESFPTSDPRKKFCCQDHLQWFHADKKIANFAPKVYKAKICFNQKCGILFTPHAKNQKYCKASCAYQAEKDRRNKRWHNLPIEVRKAKNKKNGERKKERTAKEIERRIRLGIEERFSYDVQPSEYHKPANHL